MTHPLIWILILACNAEKWISDALESSGLSIVPTVAFLRGHI